MQNITNIPAPRVPLIDDRTGLMSREWYRFFLNLFTLTGSGTTSVSLADLQVVPPTIETDLSAIYQQSQLSSMMQAYESVITAISQQIATTQSDENAAKINVLNSEIFSLNVCPQATTPHIRHAPYGEFYSTATQTAAAINTAYPITYNTTVYSDGVEIGATTSRVYVYHEGIYNFHFSMEVAKASAALGQIWIWARINGVDKAYSTGRVSLAGSNNDKVISWNYTFEMADSDYFELVWATDDTGCQIKTEAATAFSPAVPSVMLTVTDNIRAIQY